jgi:exodeoxyribonuclease VII large subunit
MLKRGLEDRMQRLDYLSKRLVHPGEALRNRLQHLGHLASRLRGAWKRFFDERSWGVRGVAQELASARPDLLSMERERLELARRLREAARSRLDGATARLAALETHLKHLNPELVLERGYSIAVNGAGAIVRSAAQVAAGETLTVKFARGSAETQVTKTNP